MRFDIETNGLLYDVSKIHCISTFDTKEEKTYVYNDQNDETPSIQDGIIKLWKLILLPVATLLGTTLLSFRA